MDAARFLIVRDSACDNWRIYEQYRLAYSSAYETNRRRATWLNWITIVLGAITTALAAIAGVPQALTVIFGVLTTIAAGLQQSFKWDEKALQFWQARTQMEQTRLSIKKYIAGVAMSGGASYDALFEDRLVRPSMEVTGLERFVTEALQNLRADAISTLELALAAPEPQDAGDEVEEGGVGIVPVQRGGAA